MKISISIKTTLFLALLTGIIVPMFLVDVYTTSSNKKKLYKDFEAYRESITSNIAKAMQDPLYYYSPDNGLLVLEVVKQDKRISKIEVYDTLGETDFITIDFLGSKRHKTYVNQAEIIRNGEVLGWVKINFNDRQLQEVLSEQKAMFLRVSFLIFIVLVMILAPLLYYKILSPLKKLLHQSKEFEDNKFEQAYFWNKTDEISLLGQSFEKARLSILDLISKLQDKNRELEKLYATDQLTTLYNRYKLDDTLIEEVQRKNRYQEYQFGVILADIDHFKQINDTYGHQVGDDVLREVASILKENIRKSDMAGRWGGEEFLLILPHTNKEGLIQLAQKVKAKIESHVFKDVGSITSSFGATLYTEKEDIKTCIFRVDKALYKAKETGRNRVVYSDPHQ